VFREFDGDGVQRMADGVWIWGNIIIGQFLLIISSAFPKVPSKVIESFFA